MPFETEISLLILAGTTIVNFNSTTDMELLQIILSIGIGALAIYQILSNWTGIWYGRKKGLPPGTMGWPLLGENASYWKLGPVFITNRQLRYGDVFKTNIFGGPTVVSMDPEINKFILTHESKGFKPGYPQSMTNILGKWNFTNLTGTEHKAMRGVLMSLITAPAMKEQLLPKINEFMESYIQDWSGRVLDLQDKSNEVVMLLILKIVAGIKDSKSSTKELQKELHHLAHGIFSLPINLPGTLYYKGLQARKKIVRMMGEMVNDRRASTCHKNDILETLLTSEDCNNNMIKLSDEQIIDLIINFFFSGYETVTSIMMLAVKYLHDHPNAQHELRKENLEIRKGKLDDYTVSWNDYKSMIFTRAVVLETLRMSSIVGGIIRKTTVDTRIKGYVIPKGWKIYVYTRESNFYPDIYPEPLKFNPWRWLESNLESHQYFMSFGGGGRLCPGKELGILEISIFLHYLVTKYSWEEVGENMISNFPRIEAPNGIYFRFSEI
ncbi:hypothetical protein LUZ60_012827 [Juncus effusus]|nr:hypothetical protein LUZ60_012827 [Juncus effusus]